MDFGNAERREGREAQRDNHSEPRRHTQTIEPGNVVVEQHVHVCVLDELSSRVNMRPKRHRYRKERHQRQHTNGRRRPRSCRRPCAARAREQDARERDGDDEHAIEVRDLQERQAQRPAEKERPCHFITGRKWTGALSARNTQRPKDPRSKVGRSKSGVTASLLELAPSRTSIPRSK